MNSRAKKGGEWVSGVFYKGGQFLPTNEPLRGALNTVTRKPAGKVRKVQVAPYEWVEAQDGKMSIFARLGGTVATVRNGEMSLTNPKALGYIGMTETQAQSLIADWNKGERWY
jgi:hypothetical protein